LIDGNSSALAVVMRNDRLRELFVGIDGFALRLARERIRESGFRITVLAFTLDLRDGQTAEINLDAEACIAQRDRIARTRVAESPWIYGAEHDEHP
jgi:hypothetical protein